MITINQFRKLMDGVKGGDYQFLIPHIQDLLLPEKISTEYGNSLLHALSFLNESHLTFDEWLTFYTEIKTKMDSDSYTDSSYNSLIKVLCSPFGYKFISLKGNFEEMITILLEEMEDRGFSYRHRTFQYIFQIAHRENLPILAMSSYLSCKVRNIELLDMDYARLLVSTPTAIRNEILFDMTNGNSTLFSEESITLLRQKYSRNQRVSEVSGQVGTHKIPKFSLTKKDRTKVLLTLRGHVENLTKSRKQILKTFDKFTEEIKKVTYSVVLDVANIGRFEQGAKSSKELNFNQIKLVVEQLVSKKESVLICLNENHLKSVSKEYQEAVRYCQDHAYIYQTTKGLDDDLFWLYASFYNETAYLVTNDELRNHINSINGHFLTWKNYHRVTYGVNKSKTLAELQFPCPYEVAPFYYRKEKVLNVPLSEKEWHKFQL